MTGREMLNQQLLNRGASKAQINSKVVDLVIDIFVKNQELMNDVCIEQRVNDGTKEIVERVKRREDDINRRQKEIENKFQAIEQKIADAKKLFDDVNQFETPQMRDAYKMYCIFQNDNEDICRTNENKSMYLKSLGEIFKCFESGSKDTKTESKSEEQKKPEKKTVTVRRI